MSEAIANLFSHIGAVLGYGVPAIAGISLAILFVREYCKATRP
jgi:hypothetical protein